MPSSRHATAEQLRRDIDRGRTGEKVDFPDPAAVPLGADSEAAGTPSTPAEITSARSLELRGPHTQQKMTLGPAIYVGIIIAIAAVLGIGLAVSD